jgi:ATP-dependent Lon protease
MATALISALTNTAVRSDVAMTGEITLRGRVLPIGGLKEKALGAMRAGIRTVIIPEKNKKELSELPQHLRRKIEFVPVKQMSEVVARAIVGTISRRKLKRTKTKRK